MRDDSRRLLWILFALVLVFIGVVRASNLGLPGKRTPPGSSTTQPQHSASTPAAPPAPIAELADCSWIAVSVDNSIPARPQTGLTDATIVYEFPAEGGITRLLAFYCKEGPEVVGPVRSVRTYMLDFARDYGAVLAHAGQSSSAFEKILRDKEPVINQFWQPKPFHRDAHRKMPHNLYASVPALREIIKTPPAPAKPHWLTVDLSSDAGPMTITVPYGPRYDVMFVYDPGTGRYHRIIDRHHTIDALTESEVQPSSILVQYVHWWQTMEDGILESQLDLVGSGRISVFTAGQRVDGTWTRMDANSPTVFADQAGNPLQLRPGLTWVAIVSSDRPVQVDRVRPRVLAQ